MTLRERIVAIIKSYDKEKSWQTFSEQEIKDQFKEIPVKDRAAIYRALKEAVWMTRAEIKCEHPQSEVKNITDMAKECQVCKMVSRTEEEYNPGFGGDKRSWSHWE